MAGPASPGGDGPTFAPPPLPAGWIAQWDGNSKKYYYVQLSTGVSQWEIPTDAAPVGGTPAHNVEHPYGVPGQPQLITHPDGTQTVKHADGTMEPILPSGDGTRGMGGGATGDRGLSNVLGNALINNIAGGHGKPHGGSHGGSHGANPLNNIAGSLIGGLSHSGGHGSSSGGHGSNALPGKLVGQLASSFFSSGNSSKPSSQTQGYHGDQSSHPSQHGGGLAGAVMGGVSSMFGGKPHGQPGQNFGYSNTGQSGGYSAPAPPTTYQPPTTGSYQPPHTQSTSNTPSYHSPPPNSYPPPGQAPHAAAYGQSTPGQTPHAPSYAAPPTQHAPSYPPPPGHQQYGQQGHVPPPPPGQPPANQYGAPAQQVSYGQPQYSTPGSYNPPYAGVPAPPSHPGGYTAQPSYGGQHGQGYPGQGRY